MDRFADLQMLVRVVEAGSISAAAERLEVAKSAVSRRLAELETRLGVELLHRTTRRLTLTDSGRASMNARSASWPTWTKRNRRFRAHTRPCVAASSWPCRCRSACCT